jgi:hypothetical protein
MAKKSMPKKTGHHHEHGEEGCEQIFLGRTISIQKQKGKLHLSIDGEEIPVEDTGRGFITHANMFKEYGSLEELAQDLVKQWGTAKIEHSKVPDPSHHKHS